MKVISFFKGLSGKLKIKNEFIVPPRPKVIHVAVSRVCNVDCIMCPINREVFKDKKKFLDLETFQKIFNGGDNFDFLNFVGAGEVFMARDFYKILDYCFKSNFSKLGSITNLQLISPDLAEYMVKNHFSQITVSIDGSTQETFEYIRKGSKFSTTIEAIEFFCKLKKLYHSDAPNITFSTVAMNSNIHELPGLVKLGNKYGVKYIYVARLHVSKEEILNESLFFHQEKYNHYYDEAVKICKQFDIRIELPPKFGTPFIQKKKIVRNCKLPFENMYIDVDGVVYPCVCRVYPDVFIGNINDNSVLQLWNSQMFNTFRQSMFSDTPPLQCKECTFNVWDPNRPESHMTPELSEKVRKKYA